MSKSLNPKAFASENVKPLEDLEGILAVIKHFLNSNRNNQNNLFTFNYTSNTQV